MILVRYSWLLPILILILGLQILLYYVSFNMLGAVRSFSVGESHYSKGEKNATIALQMYLNYPNERFKQLYKQNIAIPLSDGKARLELEAANFDEPTKRYLQEGNNHPADSEKIIWLYKHFGNSPFLKEAIHIWALADEQINHLDKIAEQVFALDSISKDEKDKYLNELNAFNESFNELETSFLNILNHTARRVNDILLYINILNGILTILVISLLLYKIVNRQSIRNEALVEQNNTLNTFSQILAHDLRAPLTATEGLLELLDLSKNEEESKMYSQLIKENIVKQKDYIQSVLTFVQARDGKSKGESKALIEVVKDRIAQLKYYDRFNQMEIAIQINENLKVKSHTAVAVVLHNLISNAIKYQDPKKSKSEVIISAYKTGNLIELNVKDNGLGMDSKTIENLQEKFIKNDTHKDSLGLGMFLTYQTVKLLKGHITVNAKLGEGSSFTITLPQ